MTQRHFVQTGLFFITTNTKDRVPYFSDPAYARAAVETLYEIQYLYPFYLYSFVIMPNHCHFLLRVPERGYLSKIMHAFKRGTSFTIGKGPIWQPRFFVRLVTDDPYAFLKYIHRNPTKAGLCEAPEDYPWSSASGRWDIHEFGWDE